MSNKVLILGIGNILLSDEGAGVHVVNSIRQKYCFSQEVSIVDGGTLGLGLIEYIQNTDYCIVIDAVQNGGEPGTIYRFKISDSPHTNYIKKSMHQITFFEMLSYAALTGKVPLIIILGIEPADITSWEIEPTSLIKCHLQTLENMVIRELSEIGVTAVLKNNYC